LISYLYILFVNKILYIKTKEVDMPCGSKKGTKKKGGKKK